MLKNEIKIILDSYHQALMESVQDDRWISNSVQYPEIFKEYFGTPLNIDVVKNNILIEDVIKYKNKNNLSYVDENVLNFNENKKNFLLQNVNETFQKTSYFASILAKLLNEYGISTRVFKSYKIIPFPDGEEDTYMPINKFKMIHDDGECKAKIVRGGLKVSGNENLADYFNKRMISKFLKTAYADEIPDAKDCQRRMIFMKSIPLHGVKILSMKPAKYKLRYIGNQTVGDGRNEFSVTNEPIHVLNIRKL
jgi:hypothetical protein